MSTVKHSASTNLGLLLMRVMLGVVFIYHGQAKFSGGLDGFSGYLDSLGVPLPMLSAWLAALAELLGGLILLAGVAFRFTLWPLVFTMLVACFTAHAGKFSVQDKGMEYPLTLAVMVTGLALVGAGDWTLGLLLGRDRDGQR